MWNAHLVATSSSHVQRLEFESDGVRLTTTGFYEQLAGSDEFRSQFTFLLAEVPFRAIRWETPPLARATASNDFECVIIDGPRLDRSASQRAFAEYFASAWDDDIAVFKNLSGDATLVVPCPAVPDTAYCHLSAFVREAPPIQQHAMWRRLADVVLERISDVPMWINTAGAGVPWLHLRLDSRPKYYHHAPYKQV